MEMAQMEKENNALLEMGRHSLSHILAKAVCELFGEVKLAIGPPIATGFYYDFDLPHTITEGDFAAIEAKMTEILKRREPFTRRELRRDEALALFADQPYKTELIEALPEGETISVYSTGEDFVDLCRGPHVENAQALLPWAFKAQAVTGAYWRGDAKNKMLQRVYVYAYPTKAELKDYLHFLEEAKKRDHRRIGREQELFVLMDEGPGFPFFLPKGMILRNQLLDFWHEIHAAAGYQEISTPIMRNEALWHPSGPRAHYQDTAYTTAISAASEGVK
jgi:threonyl-tRNA synthetase